MTAVADLVTETSTTTGTGNFALTASVGRRFSDAHGTGGTTNVFRYFIYNLDVTGEWEIGTGHCSDANTLVRDTVVSSSNANSLVNFSAGRKRINNAFPASEISGKLDASSYTAADVLAKLLTVDGAGSGVDADLLDGQSSAYYATAAALAGYQPLDAELTAISGLTSAADKLPYFTGSGTAGLTDLSSFGRSLIDDANAAAALTTLGVSAFAQTLLDDANEATFKATVNLEIGVDVQAYDADLTTWAGLTPSANAQSLVTAADYAAMRALLDLEAGTDFLSPAAIAAAYQPLDSDLTSWAGVARASGFDTFVATPSSANLRSLLSDETGAGAAVFADTPTLVTPILGTPTSGTLTNCSGLPLSGVVDSTSEALGVGSLEIGHASDTTLTRVSAGVAAIEGSNILLASGLGSITQAYDAELAAIAGLTSAADRLPYFTGSGTAALATFTSAGRALVDDADASAQRTTLGLGTAATASTGTSGTVLPFLDGANKFSAVQTISLNSGTLPSPSAGTVLHLANADGTATRLMMDAFGTGVSPNITSRRARGTAGSPSAVQTDDQILNLASFGYGATGYSGGTRGGLLIMASENWTDSAQGTYATFSVTANGTTTANNILRVFGNGSVACNVAAISTSATDGFLYVPTCAGTPTGTPTTITGLAPIVINTTNNKLYFYSGGAWRDAGP